MREYDDLFDLIGLIYDASLDPARWPGALAATARFLPGQSAALYAKDSSSKTGNIYYDDGALDPHYKQIYFDKYIKIDPANHVHVFAEVEQAIVTEDVIAYHTEFLQSRFYLEWARPQGLVDFASAVLDKSSTGAAMFGVFRHERHGLVDEEARRRMRLIIPHVRRAALIGRAIDLKTTEAATFAAVLDGIAAGVFLVDARGQAVHTNVAGAAMLEEGDVLHAPAGRLAARNPLANQALDEILTSAGSDAALGTKGIALPLTARSGDRYVAHVLPLTSGARRYAGINFAASAALFVHKATLRLAGPLEIITKTYKLTPSELRVLLAVVDVGGAPEVADALGVAETTVKFHLKRLFEKTGTRRQADLVKIVAGYSNLTSA